MFAEYPSIELNAEGSVLATYDAETFELLDVASWNGADLSCTRWERIALERLAELKELSDNN